MTRKRYIPYISAADCLGPAQGSVMKLCADCGVLEKYDVSSYCKPCRALRQKNYRRSNPGRIKRNPVILARPKADMCNCQDPACNGITCTYVKVYA